MKRLDSTHDRLARARLAIHAACRAVHAALLLIACGAAGAAPADPHERTIEEIRAVMAGNPRAGQGAPDEVAPLALWRLVARWTAEELTRHPRSTPAGVVTLIEELDDELQQGGPPRADDDWTLDATVASVSNPNDGHEGRLAYAIAVNWGWSGSFFIVGEDRRGHFAVLWQIADVAEAHFALRDELGRWAYRTPGFHDGPLQATVHELTPDAVGHGRFAVEARATPSMGCEFPGQIGFWSWDGTDATPLLVKEYTDTCDADPPTFADDLVVVQTKEPMRTFFTCGSCSDPRGTWTIRITPDGVEDLGHVLETPELAAVDELIYRVLRGQGTTDIAAPAVARDLREALEGDSLGMMEAGGVSETAPDGTRTVRLLTDLAPEMTFAVQPRGTGFYIAAVSISAEE